MTRALTTVLLSAVTALTLGGAVQAADFGPDADNPSYEIQGGFGQGDRFAHDRYRSDEQVFARPYREGRFYGRPVPDRWYHGRPVAERPGWGLPEDCRIIVKRRVNPFGDIVIRRIRICG